MVLALHPELKMPTVMPYGVDPDPIQEQVRKFIQTYTVSPIMCYLIFKDTSCGMVLACLCEI